MTTYDWNPYLEYVRYFAISVRKGCILHTILDAGLIVGGSFLAGTIFIGNPHGHMIGAVQGIIFATLNTIRTYCSYRRTICKAFLSMSSEDGIGSVKRLYYAHNRFLKDDEISELMRQPWRSHHSIIISDQPSPM